MKKQKCNICSKKVHPRVKKHTENNTDFFYIKCSKCQTVYPAYVQDKWVKDKMDEVAKLQDSTWADNIEATDAQTVIDNTKKILRLQNEVEFVSKRLLIQNNMSVFRKLGDDVYVNG